MQRRGATSSAASCRAKAPRSMRLRATPCQDFGPHRAAPHNGCLCCNRGLGPPHCSSSDDGRANALKVKSAQTSSRYALTGGQASAGRVALAPRHPHDNANHSSELAPSEGARASKEHASLRAECPTTRRIITHDGIFRYMVMGRFVLHSGSEISHPTSPIRSYLTTGPPRRRTAWAGVKLHAITAHPTREANKSSRAIKGSASQSSDVGEHRCTPCACEYTRTLQPASASSRPPPTHPARPRPRR